MLQIQLRQKHSWKWSLIEIKEKSNCPKANIKELLPCSLNNLWNKIIVMKKILMRWR